MELKVLDFKEFNHIEYKKIESKYENNPNPVTFGLQQNILKGLKKHLIIELMFQQSIKVCDYKQI